MIPAGKPIWSQGLFMRPQHFQQQERYWEAFIDAHLSGRAGYGWGLRRLELDAAALGIGRFSVAEVSAILPDGTPLDAPGIAELPLPRSFSAEAQGKRVLLALPLRRTDATEVDGGVAAYPDRRWIRRSVSVRDTSSENGEYCDLQIGRLAPALVLEDEPAHSHVTLPIARIARASETGIVLDETFLPPAMDCRAHPGYLHHLDELRSILHRRAEALARQVDPNTATGLSDTLDFLLLQALNRHEAGLAHLLQLEHIAPERAYAATAELAGELATFLPERRPAAQPAYDHADPGPGWQTLMQGVTTALGRIQDRHGVELALQRQLNGSYVATIADRNLLEHARFIVIVRPRDLPESEAFDPHGAGARDAGRIEHRLKVGSVESLREIVSLQLPGLPCEVVSVVPRGLPYHPGGTYLEILRDSPLWEDVRGSAGIAIQLVGTTVPYDISLWAVSGSASEGSASVMPFAVGAAR